ncbi:GH92 family glycosyl hydrolase [Streptomyces orinoci]|uniref:GH92 family glycosyl hydrolase n=1 Tax=Streptomyces orinoci TaxID=67339 RepID=A0ABV3JRX6_STRON|nr:GH92 family glycosyl hydrolase [Streptomyces orinoci]
MRRRATRPPAWRGRKAVLVLAAALAGAGLLPPQPSSARAEEDLTSLVNPFIGTAHEGNTFPGAAVPFGMVQLSPDTGHATGYDYQDTHIRGFSAVHLSGVGCALGGDLPVLPTTGEVTQTDSARYAAEFSHREETARPGYYRVRLASYGGITAELTATARTGLQRYTFPATDKANVLLNSGQPLHRTVASSIEVVDDHTVRSAITGRGFCGQDTLPYTVYTVTRFNRPFTAHGTWEGEKLSTARRASATTGRSGAWVRFDTTRDRRVEATTAISYVDAAGAEANLRATRGSFDRIVQAAGEEWEQRLADVRVEGGGRTLRRAFYTALYHALLSPNIGSDADGRYTGWDQRVHRANGFTYYQNWSLWDTYRSQAQLLSLIAPREARDMARSVLRVEQEGGWLPKWGYGTVETNVMTGDPVTPYLTNAYQQGLLTGYEEEAYQALRRNADGVPPAGSPSVGRDGNPRYLRDGYVPLMPRSQRHKPGESDLEQGASATLEYALADGALAEMAHDLGHRADADRFADRSRNYRHLFDAGTGFFRPRDAHGAFTGSADPARSPGFHEGTAWQYQWLVQQDLPGLIELLGGREAANRRLDSFFAYDKLRADPARTAREVWVHGPYDYYSAEHYNPENEPDINAPYTYLSTGQPWKTADVVRAALGLYTDSPDGIPGNDDLGTMSAWLVLSAIGLYPVQPGTDVWGLSTPAFDRVELRLDRRWFPEGHFTVSAPGASADGRYVQSARLDGFAFDRTYLTTAAIRDGEELEFTVGPAPSRWGTARSAAPPAIG